VRIDDLLAGGQTISFEFFPPKNDDEEAMLTDAVGELRGLAPSFVSVTYRGGASSRERTFRLVRRLRDEVGLEPMAHLTCVHHTRDELVSILTDYRDAGIENLMLLGGDADPSTPVVGELTHADELVALARGIGGFCIGVAAQTSGHPDSPDLASDRRFLAAKLELADFALTQLFFDASEWRALVDELGALSVHKPVLPGIMPITRRASIATMRDMGGKVPDWLVERLDAAAAEGRPGAVRAAGVEAATQMCADLLAEGAPGLHFYTLNRSTATREIVARLKS
jgi:methylenetetrahydrofolate reductase (NADPH)